MPAAAAALAAYVPAARADLTWDPNGAAAGTGGAGDWNTSSGSWFNGTTFQAWSNTTPQLGVFAGTAGTVTLTAGINASAGIRFDTAGYVVQGNTLQLGGSVTANADAVIKSNLTGTGGFTKSGAGVLELSGSSMHGGALTVASGVLRLLNGAAVGNGTGGTFVNDGATLELRGITSPTTEVLTLNGAGVGGTKGAVHFLSTASTWHGGVVINSNSMIHAQAGSSITGAVSGTGKLTIQGNLVLSGNNAGWTPSIALDGGGLTVGAANALGGAGAAGDITIMGSGGHLTVSQNMTRAGTLHIGGANHFNLPQFVTLNLTASVSGSTLNKIGMGTIVLAGSNTLQEVRAQEGTISVDSLDRLGPMHRISLNNRGGLLFTASTGGTSSIAVEGIPTIAVTAGHSVTLWNTPGLHAIAGVGGFAKMGGGDLVLSWANNFQGRLDLREGRILVAHAMALGASGGSYTDVYAGAALVLSDGITVTGESLNLSGAGVGATGALRLVSGNATWAAGMNIVGDASVGVDAGTLTAGAINGPARVARKVGDGTLAIARLRAGGLQIDAGEVQLLPNGTSDATSTLDTLSLVSGGAGARLDLGDNKLIVASGEVGTSGGGTYGGLTGQIQSAHNFTAWDGPGITTSMPDAASGLTTIAIATGEQIRGLGASDTDTFAGQTITGQSVILMYTYAGDANLDGQIDAGDYGIIDNFVQIAGASGYGNGDFNYDGFIDAGDYGIIDNNVQAQTTPFPTSGSAGPAGLSGVTAVPEPASLSIIGLAAATLLRRRRG